MKLCTFVVHYLQMCMKEYGCCPKFRRGDNSTYTFTKRGDVYLVSTTPAKFSRSCAYKVHVPPFRESISWIISPFKFWTATIFLHAHLQVVYYKCVKYHKNPISRLGGVALTRYMPAPPFRESISWIISPFKFWTATIFLHAHLQVVYYKCVKFHKNPISGFAVLRPSFPKFL
jgi:hypothetical protein